MRMKVVISSMFPATVGIIQDINKPASWPSLSLKSSLAPSTLHFLIFGFCKTCPKFRTLYAGRSICKTIQQTCIYLFLKDVSETASLI